MKKKSYLAEYNLELSIAIEREREGELPKNVREVRAKASFLFWMIRKSFVDTKLSISLRLPPKRRKYFQ